MFALPGYSAPWRRGYRRALGAFEDSRGEVGDRGLAPGEVACMQKEAGLTGKTRRRQVAGGGISRQEPGKLVPRFPHSVRLGHGQFSQDFGLNKCAACTGNGLPADSVAAFLNSSAARL